MYGGAASPELTVLWAEFPANREKYREISVICYDFRPPTLSKFLISLVETSCGAESLQGIIRG